MLEGGDKERCGLVLFNFVAKVSHAKTEHNARI